VRLRFRKEIVCQQWVELVTDYLEGALSTRMTKAIDRHLAGCEHCQEYLDQFRRSIELTGELPDEPAPPELLDALTQAFLEAERDDP
jgi:anti-sigma factor RsiW